MTGMHRTITRRHRQHAVYTAVDMDATEAFMVPFSGCCALEAEKVTSRKRGRDKRFLAMAYCVAVDATCVQRRVPMRSQSQGWCDFDVIGFTKTFFIQNFRMSRHSFDYICLWLSTRLQRTLRKCVGVGLYQLATVAGYTVPTDS